MKKYFLFFTTCFVYSITFSQPYKKLHFNAILIDTHNDIPTTAIDKILTPGPTGKLIPYWPGQTETPMP
jgi:hypothetical protein